MTFQEYYYTLTLYTNKPLRVFEFERIHGFLAIVKQITRILD